MAPDLDLLLLLLLLLLLYPLVVHPTLHVRQ
jgi:hypothetical protein